MKKIAIVTMAIALATTFCGSVYAQKTDLSKKVSQYAPFTLTTNMDELSPREQELVDVLIKIASLMDDIYWEQSFGPDARKKLNSITDARAKEFAQIHYGVWDRLDGNKPFVDGFGERPKGAFFYPADMTDKEFEALKDPQKTSPYTLIRRDAKGNLEVVPYHKAYAAQLERARRLFEKAMELTEDDAFRNYLNIRLKALLTDDYFESDMAWMDVKKSNIDFVVGPIENYDDDRYGYKTSYEAFVLVRDRKWSDRLAHFTEMLPELQKELPCDPRYKNEVPGTESDINVYDVIYYAGDCNAGSKTIAINLPNDEDVQLKKGTRRLQLKNAMQAKFDKILLPIAKLMISNGQLKNVKFDAFFNNVCFHEVAHGLGIKNTINGKGTVREALQNQYSAWEEAKADICGLYIVQTLIERGHITDITVEDAYVTFIAGLMRSVRFGVTEAHGVANMMCFNYLQDNGAFSKDKQGRYTVNIKNMRKAVEGWAALVIKTEGDGDYKAAKNYAAKNGVVRPELQKDLQVIEKADIPIDIRYKQGRDALDLKANPRELRNSIRPTQTLKMRKN